MNKMRSVHAMGYSLWQNNEVQVICATWLDLGNIYYGFLWSFSEIVSLALKWSGQKLVVIFFLPQLPQCLDYRCEQHSHHPSKHTYT